MEECLGDSYLIDYGQSHPPPSSTSYPEFAVRRETISRYFNLALANSTFHALVNKGEDCADEGYATIEAVNG